MPSMQASGSLALVLMLAGGCGDDSPESDAETAMETATGGATDPQNTTGGPEGTTTSGELGPTTTGGDTSSDATGPSGESSSGDATGEDSGSSTSGKSEGPTWNNFGADFFNAYCSECHGAGDPEGRDYSTLAGVVPELASIRCGTGPASTPPADCDGEPPAEQFPIGANLPTEAERITLVEWIDAGAPEG